MQIVQPWLDWLGQFKIGAHGADQTEKAWNSVQPQISKMGKPERDYLQQVYDAKISAMVEAEKK
jgi:hypothetical protein